ncbi:MAG: PASTA domain-containing protein, partial [Ruminiclostridium sp.]|nr:PASTA domain-containing protein [Ruminiclostridium sp.]
MKNREDNVRQVKFTEITPEYAEPKKSHKVLNVLFGIAGTAAVLAGAVFGLKFLADNGGLKGPDVQGAGAGSSAASETELLYTMPAKEGEEFVAPTSNTVDPETLPDISELYGKPVQFHDATVWLNRAEYDGETFTARFSLLYTGDNYETYSPEYVKLTVGTPIDYTTEKFSIEEVPEADSYTHRCTYSVPVKLETGKSYAMGIEYLNTGGKNTQPIEADRQHYKYVYKPMREFWELPDLTGMNIDDAAGTLQKLGINYSITRSESNEVPENFVIRTVPEAGAAVEKKSTIVAVYVSSDTPSSFDTFAEAGEAYGYDLLDFGVGARIYTTNLYGCNIIQSSKYVDNYSESGTVTTTIGTQDSKSEKPELTTQTVLIADTPEDRISGLAQMNGFDPEKLEHESYFSDNLGLTVDTYYGR